MIIIEIKITKEDDDSVKHHLVRVHLSDYAYEIKGTFEQLGEQVAKLVDPGWESN